MFITFSIFRHHYNVINAICGKIKSANCLDCYKVRGNTFVIQKPVGKPTHTLAIGGNYHIGSLSSFLISLICDYTALLMSWQIDIKGLVRVIAILPVPNIGNHPVDITVFLEGQFNVRGVPRMPFDVFRRNIVHLNYIQIAKLYAACTFIRRPVGISMQGIIWIIFLNIVITNLVLYIIFNSSMRLHEAIYVISSKGD